MCEQLCLHFYKWMDWGVIWFVHKNPHQTWWSRYLMVFFGRKSCKKMLGEIRGSDRRWRLFGTGLRSGCRCRYLSHLLQYYHNITTFMILKLILDERECLNASTSWASCVWTGAVGSLCVSLCPSITATVSASTSFTHCLMSSESTGTPVSTNNWRPPPPAASTATQTNRERRIIWCTWDMVRHLL